MKIKIDLCLQDAKQYALSKFTSKGQVNRYVKLTAKTRIEEVVLGIKMAKYIIDWKDIELQMETIYE